MIDLKKCIVIISLLWLQLDARKTVREINQNDTNETSNNIEEAELIFAHVLYRHGDRNPVEPYPTDPYKNESLWPRGFGQLTNIGMQQHYELGKYLRRRYQSILGGGRYLNDIVYVRCTDYDRTLMSAASNLAGLFPPQDDQIWNEDLLWQPVPIHTIPEDLDELYNGKKCDRYERAMRKYTESHEYKAMFKEHKELFEYLEAHSGEKIENLDDVQHLYNTLWIQQLRNKTLPEWTREVFVDGGEFPSLAFYSFSLPTNTQTLARLSTGFMIRDILERFTQKIESKLSPDRSLWIYSGHDTQIANILNYLGLFEPHYPPYASSLHFELYKKDAEFYMQFFYRNSTAEVLSPLDIPSCGTKCPIQKFYEIYNAKIPTASFDEECDLSFFGNLIEGNFVWGTDSIIAVVVLFIVVPLLIIIAWKLCSIKRGTINMDSENPKHL